MTVFEIDVPSERLRDYQAKTGAISRVTVWKGEGLVAITLSVSMGD